MIVISQSADPLTQKRNANRAVKNGYVIDEALGIGSTRIAHDAELKRWTNPAPMRGRSEMSEAGIIGTMIMLLVLPLAFVVRDLQKRVNNLEKIGCGKEAAN